MDVKDFLLATNALTQKYYGVDMYQQKILATNSFEDIGMLPLATDVQYEVMFATNTSPLCVYFGECATCILAKYNDECAISGSSFNIFAEMYEKDKERKIDLAFRDLILSYNIALSELV